MTVAEAADLSYFPDEELYEHVLDTYTSMIVDILYGETFDRLGGDTQFSFNDIKEEQLIAAYKQSPNATRPRDFTDLSDKTEVTLPDGRKIPINQHLLKKQD